MAATDSITGIDCSAEGILVGDEVLVPPGRYQAGYLDHSTRRILGRIPKLVLRFQIAEGEFMGVVLRRYYGVRRLIGREGPKGRFQVGRKSDFARDFATLFAPRMNRLDRLPMSFFDGCLFEVRVTTVDTRYDQKSIPKALQYSVVTDIPRILNRLPS
jgi:hypothetical protein